MHYLDNFYFNPATAIDLETESTQKLIKTYFDKKIKSINSIYHDIHLPLLKQLHDKGFTDSPCFFNEYCISFDPSCGFDVHEAKYNSPANVFRTLSALSQVVMRIFEEENRSFKLSRCSVHQSVMKPIIRWIHHNPDYQTSRIFEVIENYKNWFSHQRDNTILPSTNTQALEESSITQHMPVSFLLRLPKNPPLPEEHPIVESDKKHWIALHTSQDRKTAKKFAKNITYISCDKFIERLQASIESFKKTINNQPYIIVLPAECTQKSNYWVTSIAIKYLQDTPPVQVLKDTQLPHFLCGHEDIKNLVCIDDASYSGDQMETFIADIMNANSNFTDLKFYLIVPFMAMRAENKLRNYWISERQKMFCVSELFNGHDEILIRKNATESTSVTTPGSLALTYFAHKIADVWSVHAALNYGTLLGTPEKEWLSVYRSKTQRLAPDFVPPYKY